MNEPGDCKESRARLVLSVYDEDCPERAAAEAHLSACGDCRAERARLAAIREDLENVSLPEPPPDLLKRALARVERLRHDAQTLPTSSARTGVAALAARAAGLVAATLAVLLLVQPAPSPPKPAAIATATTFAAPAASIVAYGRAPSAESSWAAPLERSLENLARRTADLRVRGADAAGEGWTQVAASGWSHGAAAATGGAAPESLGTPVEQPADSAWHWARSLTDDTTVDGRMRLLENRIDDLRQELVRL